MCCNSFLTAFSKSFLFFSIFHYLYCFSHPLKTFLLLSSLNLASLFFKTDLECFLNFQYSVRALNAFSWRTFILAKVLPLPAHKARISLLIDSSSACLVFLPSYSLSCSISLDLTPSRVLHLLLSFSICKCCSFRRDFFVFKNS